MGKRGSILIKPTSERTIKFDGELWFSVDQRRKKIWRQSIIDDHHDNKRCSVNHLFSRFCKTQKGKGVMHISGCRGTKGSGDRLWLWGRLIRQLPCCFFLSLFDNNTRSRRRCSGWSHSTNSSSVLWWWSTEQREAGRRSCLSRNESRRQPSSLASGEERNGIAPLFISSETGPPLVKFSWEPLQEEEKVRCCLFFWSKNS